ncbi:GntR family transcriptional regulator [Pseudotabrizicola sp. 4114]|uniref:GntR family transcriptional regulator n=1 Tax=Pseudotabrizicola sp. 4114 TaxID=2817731 RepID=UPI00285FCFB5|nr:DNA-binding GntR family transcriptional regulator [Pseudorhodobacter sp. 4114]
MQKAYFDIVQEWVKDSIAEGLLPEGTRLTVAAVADRLDLSRSPVKRGLELLTNAGHLTRDERTGYIVGNGTKAAPHAANLFTLPLPDLAPATGALARTGWERLMDEVAEATAACIPFGIYTISESGIGAHFGVSRTVTREVLSRLHERGAIGKDRASHWIAGPLSARMLDEEHALRRLLEPAALAAAAPIIQDELPAMQARLAAARPNCPPEDIDIIEADLHDTCTSFQPNRRLAAVLMHLRSGRRVNRLFAAHVVQHDESALLTEHRLVLDHLALGNGEGAAAAMRHHLDADHARTRERLKVLSVFEDPVVAPYLTRVG